MRVGIRAPYAWQEATQMAVSLAETLTRFGLRISYLPTQSEVSSLRGPSVHHRWDFQIKAKANTAFDDWLKTVDPLVWFSVEPVELQKAAKKGRKNFLVVLWHDLSPDTDEYLPLFDRVLCPTRASYDMLRNRLTARRNLLHLDWDSSLALEQRRGRRCRPDERRLFVHVDVPTVEKHGLVIVKIVARLLLADPSVRVALSNAADWDEKTQLLVNMLLDREDTRERFIQMDRTCFLEREDAYLKHDWVWAPSIVNNASATLLEALASARPVIAFDAPPADELVIDRFNGRLIPCKYGGRPGELAFDPFKAEEIVQDAVLNDRNMIEIHKHVWANLEQRRRHFLETWRGLLKKACVSADDADVLQL